MSDIFSRLNQNFGGAIAADGAKLVFAGSDGGALVSGVGLITQSANVGYSQQVTFLYEVGTDNTFMVQGRARGQMGLNRVLGPRPVQAAFYRAYGNVCNAANNNIGLIMAAGCDQPGQFTGLSLFIRNMVLISIGFSVNAQDQIMNETLQSMFVALDLK